MPPTTTVPVSVAPEARSLVAELGFQLEFEQLIEYARSTIQGICGIEVTLDPPYDTGAEDQVVAPKRGRRGRQPAAGVEAP